MMPTEVKTGNTQRFMQLPILRKTFLVVLFLLTYIYAQVLPMDWSWENGPLEMLQNLVLAVGFVLTCFYAVGTAEKRLRQFWVWLLPVWALLLGRELSWGRVLFPVEVGKEGPVFLAKEQLPLGNLINPLIGLLLLVVLVAFVRYRIYQIPLRIFKEKKFPFFETAIMGLAAVLAHLGEKMPHSAFGGRGLLVEELCEIVVYTSLVLICSDIKWKNRLSNDIGGNMPRNDGKNGNTPHISGAGGN